MKHVFSILMLMCFSTNSVYAHQVLVDEHAQLVPIPGYSEPEHGATGMTSLNALTDLLDTFGNDIKGFFMFELTAQQRSNWSNLPARFVDRSGISIAEMSDEQRSLLFKFLSASLGEQGYRQVAKVMAAEAFLSGDPRATFMRWNPENYWFSVYGTPDAGGSWGWQFGGHHLALNVSVNDGQLISASPSFIGTEPAVFSYENNQYETLVANHQAGWALYTSLDENQKPIATLKSVPNDVVTGPGRDGLIPPQVGILGKDLSGQQQQLLLDVINTWVSIQPNESAEKRMQEIKSQIEHTSFAWIGVDEVNTPSYFRIQGPSLIIELLSTEANVGDSAKGLGHYHTIYRNLMLEYGQAPRR